MSDSEKRTVDRAIALYERIILEGEEVASSQLEGTTGNRPAHSAISPELQREIDAMIEEVKRINGD